MPTRVLKANRLRPIFFRLGTCKRAFSGWLDLDSDNIWAAADDVQEIAQAMGTDDALALLDLPVNVMGVVLIPRARKAMLPGERLEFAKALDLYPNDFIERGERCIVVRRDRNSGAVEVFLEGYHAEKTLDVTPHRSSDVLDVLEPYMDAFTEPAIAMRADFTE